MNLQEQIAEQHLVFNEQSTNQKTQEIREKAMDIFTKQGIPTNKDEEWKYTSLKNFLSQEYQLIAPTQKPVDAAAIEQHLFTEIDAYRLVFINGRYHSMYSQTTHNEGDICILSSALEKERYAAVVENYFNTSTNKDEVFFALNSSFAKEGAYIFIPDGCLVSKPVQIIHLVTEAEQDSFQFPRNLVVVGRNSSLQVIESVVNLSDKEIFTNTATEIFAEPQAQVEWVKLQNDSSKSILIDHTTVTQQRDSTVKVFTFALDGKMIRNNLNFYQQGENCNSVLNGVTYIKENQHVDHHTYVDHLVPNCESHELYRGIYDGQASGVFNGKIMVHKEAQKTNAFQQNNNILLSDQASIDTKPQLEIFADDVKCSHGCTVGQLDQDALFYMQSRGIPRDKALALMLLAFTHDVWQELSITHIKKYIQQLVTQKLGVQFDI